MGKGQVTIGPVIGLAILTLCISVFASLVAAGTWKGEVKTEVAHLKEEQLMIRENIKPIPGIQAELLWLTRQLTLITKHLGAPEAKK